MDKVKFMTTEYSKVKNKLKDANTNKNLICEEFCYSVAQDSGNAKNLIVRLNKLREIDYLISKFKAAH